MVRVIKGVFVLSLEPLVKLPLPVWRDARRCICL